jgi:hypothetical protein
LTRKGKSQAQHTDVESQPESLAGHPSNHATDSTAPPGRLVYEYALPARMPDGWLNEIKNSVKENRTALILTTILSSSLLAGLASIGGNYLIEYRKASLLIRGKLAGDRYDNYRELYKKIGDLDRSLKSTGITLKLAETDRTLTPDNISETIVHLSEAGLAVSEAADSPFVEEDSRNLVNGKILNQLAPKVKSAQESTNENNRRQALSELANTCNSLTKEIKEIKNHLYQRMQSLSP